MTEWLKNHGALLSTSRVPREIEKPLRVAGIPATNLFSHSTKSPRRVCPPSRHKNEKDYGHSRFTTAIGAQCRHAEHEEPLSLSLSLSLARSLARPVVRWRGKGHKNVRGYPKVVRFAAQRIRMHRPDRRGSGIPFSPPSPAAVTGLQRASRLEKHPSSVRGGCE